MRSRGDSTSFAAHYDAICPIATIYTRYHCSPPQTHTLRSNTLYKTKTLIYTLIYTFIKNLTQELDTYQQGNLGKRGVVLYHLYGEGNKAQK